MLGKAAIYMDSKIEEALSLLRKVISINPLVPLDVYYQVGLCFVKLEDFEKA